MSTLEEGQTTHEPEAETETEDLSEKARHVLEIARFVSAAVWDAIANLQDFAKPDISLDPNKSTLVVLPGFSTPAGSLRTLIKTGRERGFNINPVKLRLSISSITSNAVRTVQAVRTLEEKIDNMAMLAFSMGGLVARKALQIDPELPISRVITLGTPHQGSVLAQHLQWIPSCREAADPVFIASLAGPADSRVVSIAARADEIVPPENSVLAGASNITIEEAGTHHSLIENPVVLKRIFEVIDGYVK